MLIRNLFTNKWLISLILFSVYIIYGTTLPFRFTMDPEVVSHNWQRLIGFLYNQPVFPKHGDRDAFANVLFFIPFGLFFYNMIHKNPNGKKEWLTIVQIGIAGFLLSLFVETLQIFTHNRTSSISDLITNTLGSIIGAGIGFSITKTRYREKIRRLFYGFIGNSAGFLLFTYIILLTLGALAPYNFTLSAHNFSNKIRHLSSIKALDQPVQLFSLLFIYGGGGFLFAHFFKNRYPEFSLLKRYFYSFSASFSVMMGIEAMQFFVSSRYFSLEDIILGFMGVMYGILAYIALHFKNIDLRTKQLNILIFFIINYIFFLIYKYSYPFQFYTDSATILKRLQFFFFHVQSYTPSSSPIRLMIMGIKNILLYVPAGMVVRELYYRIQIIKKRRIVSVSLLTVILIPKAIQLINSSQIPLLFDLLGILIGLLTGYFVWKEYREYLESLD